MFNRIRQRIAVATTTQRSPSGFERIRKTIEARRRKSTNVETTASDIQHPIEHHIPDPTWSLQDLELTSTHNSVPDHELRRLAKLVLVDTFENNENGQDDISKLMKQDLGNMLHMIQHVTKYDYQESIRKGKDDSSDTEVDNVDDTMADATTYDTVRGLKSMPLRKGIELDALQTQDATQAQNILDQNLTTKMVNRGGGHKYFAIETAES